MRVAALLRPGVLTQWETGLSPDTHLFGINRLAEHDHQVAFVETGGRRLPGIPDILKVLRLSSSHHDGVIKQLSVLSRLEDFDCLLPVGFENASLLLAARLFRRESTPPIILIDFHYRKGQRFFDTLPALLRGADAIMCVSAQSMRILEGLPALGQRTWLLPMGVDASFFTPTDAQDHGAYILSVGQAFRDFETLREACGEDIPIAIATMYAREPLLGMVERWTSGGSHRQLSPMVGSADAMDLRDLYSRARFVVVSLRPVEGNAGETALLEAMAMGKAVLASETGGVPTYVKDNRNGLFFSPGDVTDLQRGIQYLMDNPEEANRMGRNARADVEAHYSTEVIARRLAAVIRKVALA